MNIKDIIKDNEVIFDRLRLGNAFYVIRFVEDGNAVAYEFPVPLSDVGDAILYKIDKAIYFMRYIRKALENKEFIKIS